MGRDNKTKSDKKKSSLSGTGILVAVFVLGLLVLLVLFLLFWERIAGNLKATDFFSKMGLKTPEVVEKTETPSRNENDVLPTETVSIDLNGTGDAPSVPRSSVLTENEAASRAAEEARNAAPAGGEQSAAAPQNGGDQSSGAAAPSRNEISSVDARKQATVNTSAPNSTMDLTLYFMRINSSGEVSRTAVVRHMKRSGSPLMDAINALITGPDAEEEDNGCRTLVSDGSKLLGASVRDGTATLNFNENFEFNRYGIEGLRGQLQQIVFTATAFPTVDNVQFLVNGEKRDYLGSEGVWIGSPLDRNSF